MGQWDNLFQAFDVGDVGTRFFASAQGGNRKHREGRPRAELKPRPTSKKADAQKGEDAEATAQRGNHPKTNPRHAEAGEARGS